MSRTDQEYNLYIYIKITSTVIPRDFSLFNAVWQNVCRDHNYPLVEFSFSFPRWIYLCENPEIDSAKFSPVVGLRNLGVAIKDYGDESNLLITVNATVTQWWWLLNKVTEQFIFMYTHYDFIWLAAILHENSTIILEEFLDTFEKFSFIFFRNSLFILFTLIHLFFVYFLYFISNHISNNNIHLKNVFIIGEEVCQQVGFTL